MAKLIVDREVPLHKKRRGKHVNKPWKIETRYIGPVQTGFMARLKLFKREWHSHGSYATEKAMNDAFGGLTSKGGAWDGTNYEYRKVLPPA
jgi:hypothetical protein